jgi:hypothetical protein
MDHESFTGGHKTENIITGNGLAAIGKVIEYLVPAFTENDELGILAAEIPGDICILARLEFGLYRSWLLEFVAQKLEFLQLPEVDAPDGNAVKEIQSRLELVV